MKILYRKQKKILDKSKFFFSTPPFQIYSKRRLFRLIRIMVHCKFLDEQNISNFPTEKGPSLS